MKDKIHILLQFKNRYTFKHRLKVVYSLNFEHNSFDDIEKSNTIKATGKVSYFLQEQKRPRSVYAAAQSGQYH